MDRGGRVEKRTPPEGLDKVRVSPRRGDLESSDDEVGKAMP
jgi:hypothetical protein